MRWEPKRREGSERGECPRWEKKKNESPAQKGRQSKRLCASSPQQRRWRQQVHTQSAASDRRTSSGVAGEVPQTYIHSHTAADAHPENRTGKTHNSSLSASAFPLFFFLFSLARVWQLSRENRVGCHCSEAALANSSFVFLENERSRSRNSIRISLIFLLRSRGHRFHYRGSVYETSFSPKK